MLVRIGRGRPRRHRLGRGADAEGGDRGRDGRQPHGPAGAPHEPGAPQAHGGGAPDGHDAHVPEPAAPEDRRHVRLAGDDDRRQRAQVLRVDALRRAPHRPGEGRRRAGRRADAGQGRQEQMCAARSREAEFEIRWGTGVDAARRAASIWASRAASSTRAGNHLSFAGTPLGNGRERSRDTLAENAELQNTLRQAILAAGPVRPGRRTEASGVIAASSHGARRAGLAARRAARRNH